MNQTYLQVRQPVLTLGPKDLGRLEEAGSQCGIFPINTISEGTPFWNSWGIANIENPKIMERNCLEKSCRVNINKFFVVTI
jgi:hypothetical protein